MYGQSHPLFVCLGHWPGFCHGSSVEIEKKTTEPASLSGETWRKKHFSKDDGWAAEEKMVKTGLTNVWQTLFRGLFPGSGTVYFLI